MVSLRTRWKSTQQTDSNPKKAIPSTDDDEFSNNDESGSSLSDPPDDYPDPNPAKPEPATDAEPISSDDEIVDDEQSDGSENTPRKPRLAGRTLEEKLAQDSEVKKESKPPSSGRKRTAKEMLDDGDKKDGIFSSFMRSSHSQPFSKRRSYSLKSRKTPSSSMVELHPPSSATQPKSVSASASASGKVESPEENEDKDNGEEDGFKVPRDLDTDTGFKHASASSLSVPTSSRGPEVADSDDDSLSTAMSWGSLNSLLKGDDEEPEYLCPMCKEPVEPELLIKFQAQPRQRIRDQQVFCESHRKSSAEEEWQEKGYPTIDWEGFDERIQAHFDDLEKIMVPDSSSYYRNVLDTTLKSGKAKNFRLSLAGDGLETMSCGYYGTRGSDKMLLAITTRFARKLRRLAVEDHIVKQAGVVPYAQAVLVPELAVRLIKEDMGVDDDTARQIMRESIDIGEKLNFALNDKVPVTEESDEAALQN
ncbi:RTC4-like domain-containing protein [Aspergillus cavernicola]|uniref:Restriction of telomere capping protein 4 n=1 Tax=Aspergillus cavernicola TaxID=176166 RepID=A0ABR4IGB0_9EURO